MAPELVPRTWYGFPAYAKDGKVVLITAWTPATEKAVAELIRRAVGG